MDAVRYCIRVPTTDGRWVSLTTTFPTAEDAEDAAQYVGLENYLVTVVTDTEKP